MFHLRVSHCAVNNFLQLIQYISMHTRTSEIIKYIDSSPSAISCGSPPAAPANGRRSGSGTTYQSTVTYNCNAGYSPIPPGPNTITCMANGQWSGSVPVCNCKLPHNQLSL